MFGTLEIENNRIIYLKSILPKKFNLHNLYKNTNTWTVHVGVYDDHRDKDLNIDAYGTSDQIWYAVSLSFNKDDKILRDIDV